MTVVHTIANKVKRKAALYNKQPKDIWARHKTLAKMSYFVE